MESMKNIRQRLSIATGIAGIAAVSTENKGELDEQMRGLYMSPADIDRKCAESVSSYASTVPRKSITQQVKEAAAATPAATSDELSPSYEKSTESVVEGLPVEYFSQDYDPIAPHLIEISTWEDDEMIEKFMNKIEEADTDKDVIIGHLTTMIDANYNDLMDCMRNVQSIDVDLCRAGIQIGHGRQRIRSACDIIHSGAIKVKGLHTKRGKFQKMSETIRSLQALKGIHKSMLGNINTGEVGKAANHAKSVLECLKSEAYDKFVALKSIGRSTEKSIVTIRQKSDKALKRLCGRKFTNVDYENIMTSYILLDHMSDTMDIDMYDVTDKMQDSSASFYFDSVGCIDGLAQRISRYQLDDIDDCLHTAVTEYIYAAQLKTNKGASELDIVGAYLQQQMGSGEFEDIVEVPLNMLYRHLTADVIAPCVVRSCELLAEVVHTHFLLTQWHRAPFDSRNGDSSFLHRRPLDVQPVQPELTSIAVLNVKTNRQSLGSNNSSNGLGSPQKAANENHSEIIDLGKEFHDEESDGEGHETSDTELEDGEAAVSMLASTYRKMSQVESTLSQELTNEIMSSFTQYFPHILHKDMDKDHLPHISMGENLSATEMLCTSNPDCGLKLAMVFDRLQQSRAILWEEMLRALVSMLNMMTFTSEVKIEDFLAMAWALNNMVELGKEFCGSHSKVLINTLQDKSKEYFHNFHCESFQMIRDMLEAESWQSVPIDLESSGGILGIIKSTLIRDAARSGKIIFNSASTVSCTTAGAEESGAVSAGTTPGTTSDEAESTTGGATPHPTILMRFGVEGNPFHFMTNSGSSVVPDIAASLSSSKNKPSGSASAANSNGTTAAGVEEKSNNIERKELRSFWKLLQNTAGEAPPKSKRAAEQQAYTVVTQTALNGVAKYVAKYLHLMYLLPASSKGIFDNLCQMFDYYLCAVFNGFMPFDERQKFMAEQTKANAPAPISSKEFELLHDYLERALDIIVETSTTDAYAEDDAVPSNPFGGHGSSSTLDSSGEPIPSPADSPMASGTHHSAHGLHSAHSGHHSASSHHNVHSAVNTPAAPVQGLTPQVSMMLQIEGTKMSELLRPPGIPLNIESTCMALNERIVAAESCCFIAMILQELKSKIVKLVAAEHGAAVEQFVSQYQRVAGQLRALIYRASCPQLIKFNVILGQITDCSWDSKKMRSEVHDWVPRLADNCRAVWDYMMLTEQFAESSPLLREQVWLEICQSAFDVCLEGYSKVRKCSVEGRSAMTTDNIALHDALNTIHLCRPPRGKHYIDNFLRSAMLSEEDLMQWVRDNWESYAYRHVHGLLTQVLFSMLNSKKLKDATAVIDGLYDLKDSETTSTLSGLLSQGDGGTFSRAFNSTFRRQSINMGMMS